MDRHLRFGTMVAPFTLVVFGLVQRNTGVRRHASFRQARAWRALLTGATLALRGDRHRICMQPAAACCSLSKAV